jgi:hypothetical protein
VAYVVRHPYWPENIVKPARVLGRSHRARR